jgi:hypothetical protein
MTDLSNDDRNKSVDITSSSPHPKTSLPKAVLELLIATDWLARRQELQIKKTTEIERASDER